MTLHAPCLSLQEDLKFLQASEDANEEFYGGGGSERPLEHFPQLWCPNGTYSAYGQVRYASRKFFRVCGGRARHLQHFPAGMSRLACPGVYVL